ncbi:hypothetical protein [Curtobacterium oceanosedimentum]|uniref:hypothetical protein n=1 Tax=Curtobacterium oceanosedimentum TaxID=465820 RepID=UPI0033985790
MSPDALDDTTADAVHSEWAAVLDALECELTASGPTATDATTDGTVETAATVLDATPWAEPTTLGPVPRALVGRASRLLAAQRDRMSALETERRQTLEHLGALRQVAATDEPRGSVYLDASA